MGVTVSGKVKVGTGLTELMLGEISSLKATVGNLTIIF